uniref:exodeoxyribonuclease III n=1 Tax=Neolamprologus brichardi TaxID=32507 RepID=A0A3Q4M5S7_NEOBR
TIPFIFKTQICDPGGRFILVTGTVNSTPVVLLNIYAPNFDNPDFFSKIFNLVSQYNDHNIIIGGDFNCYFDPLLDRSSASLAPTLRAVSVLNTLTKSLDLVDIWRHQHPLEKQYSFFSPVHGSFSRIDYFLIDSRLISKVVSSTYHSILVSDHAPLSTVIDFNLYTPQYNWKFNPSLYLNDSFTVYLSTKKTQNFYNSMIMVQFQTRFCGSPLKSLLEVILLLIKLLRKGTNSGCVLILRQSWLCWRRSIATPGLLTHLVPFSN